MGDQAFLGSSPRNKERKMEERTVKCPICGRPYKVMAFYAGDQSACPKCIAEAEQNTYGNKYNKENQ
jgi:uncharacterized paraquat-inducible protein A